MHSQLTAQQRAIQARAIDYLVQSMAAAGGSGMLYGPDNRVIPPARFGYSKRAAGNTGSLRNWRPRAMHSDHQVTRERETIQSRICDLVGSDPHAAGVVNTFPQTVVGSGLVPYPAIDDEILDGITREQADDIENAQRLAVARWWKHADAAGRMHFGEIQYLWEKCLIQYGESLTLVHMKKRPGSRYGLCLRALNPMRLKTPSDKRSNGNIMDGVELDRDGSAVAVWIKKSEPGRTLTDAAANFERIPVRRGHRWQVLHDFIAEDPEQVRGVSPLASCIKGFKDLGDFMNAELVSNVVTAAFAIFIELQAGQNPAGLAENMASFYDVDAGAGGGADKTRYQEIDPGSVMYGNTGEKPHAISANRPGTTFEPFVREIKKAFSHGLNIPYPVLFKDVDGVSHAGFRSAMLEAWRVYYWRRQHLGKGPSQKVLTMLSEEAFLNGDFSVPGGTSRFYRDIDILTAAEWVGAPKGDIEPYKAAKADLLLWENNAKTMERIILDHGGGNPPSVVRQVDEEKKDLRARGLLGDSAGSQTRGDSELTGGDAGENPGRAASANHIAAIAEAVADELEGRK